MSSDFSTGKIGSSGSTDQSNGIQNKNVDPEVKAYMKSHPGVSEAEAKKAVEETKNKEKKAGQMDQSNPQTPPTGSIFKS